MKISDCAMNCPYFSKAKNIVDGKTHWYALCTYSNRPCRSINMKSSYCAVEEKNGWLTYPGQYIEREGWSARKAEMGWNE